jgi:hypothetical protein
MDQSAKGRLTRHGLKGFILTPDLRTGKAQLFQHRNARAYFLSSAPDDSNG